MNQIAAIAVVPMSPGATGSGASAQSGKADSSFASILAEEQAADTSAQDTPAATDAPATPAVSPTEPAETGAPTVAAQMIALIEAAQQVTPPAITADTQPALPVLPNGETAPTTGTDTPAGTAADLVAMQLFQIQPQPEPAPQPATGSNVIDPATMGAAQLAATARAEAQAQAAQAAQSAPGDEASAAILAKMLADAPASPPQQPKAPAQPKGPAAAAQADMAAANQLNPAQPGLKAEDFNNSNGQQGSSPHDGGQGFHAANGGVKTLDATPAPSQMPPAHAAAFSAALIQAQSAATPATIANGTATQAAIPLDALAVNIARRFESGSSEFEISLHPAELGKLDISLKVSDDGRVHAVLRAERADTLDLLQRDQRTLETQLKQAGLDVGSNSLSFQLSAGNGQRQNLASGAQLPGFSLENDADIAATTMSTWIAVPRRDGLDLRI